MTQNDLPLVSILAITYNQVDCLAETVESILNNGYPNIQIVLSDDASSDGTQDLIKEYAKKYPDKVTAVLVEKNTGITQNCQRAMDACKGKYVALFSGDDIFLPGKLEKQVSIMEADDDITICFHDMILFGYEDNRPESLYSTHLSTPVGRDYNDLIRANFMGAPSVLLRRSALPASGYDHRLPVAADWLLNIEIASQGKIVYLDEPFVKYRKSVRSATLDRQKDVWANALETIDILEEKGLGSKSAQHAGRARLMLSYLKILVKKDGVFPGIAQANKLLLEKGGLALLPLYWLRMGWALIQTVATRCIQKLAPKEVPTS